MKPLALQMDGESEESTYRLGSSLSEINVVPLVDVVLVLLLIFMLTAPMMYRGVDVKIPQSGKHSNPSEMEDRMILALTKTGEIYLNERLIPYQRLAQELKALFKSKKDKTLYFKADRGLSYGHVVQVMNRVREAGIEKIGMMTEARET